MKTYWFVLVFFCSLGLHAQFETHVTIETEGHMAAIKGMCFSPNGKLLFTASDDKTLRIWDVENEILLKTYRGYIDNGLVGSMATVAISPDGSQIAVAGILGKHHKDYGSIRLIDSNTGEIKNVILGHESSVVALEFTSNGKFLISGSNDGNIGIWNTSSMEGGALSGHTSGVYGISISPDMTRLVSSDDAGIIMVWRLDKLLFDGKLDYKVIDKHTSTAKVKFSPTGEYFVSVSKDNYIYLWNKNGGLVKKIDHNLDPKYGEESNFGDLHTVSFTQNGNKIVVGAQKADYNRNVFVYEIPSGKKLGEFRQHTNTVICSAIHGNNLVATAGGDDREIFLWDINNFKVKSVFKGNGKRVWKIAAGPNYEIAFGTVSKNQIVMNNNGSLNKKFSLATMEYLGETYEFKGFLSEITKTDSFSLKQISFTQINISNGKKIELVAEMDGTLRCATITPNHKIILGTSYGLYQYNSQGEFEQRMTGHSADVYSVACSHDGKFLFSASADQTINIWDLHEIGQLEKTYDEFLNEMTKEEYQWMKEKYGTDYIKSLYTQGYQKEIKPIASIFISADNEWICWSRSNYYATSQNGSRFVGFHKNNGLNQKADFLTFEQFDIKYNRPDILLTDLGTSNDTLIKLYKKAYQKRLEKLGLKEHDIFNQKDAPTLNLTTLSQVIEGDKINLKMSVAYKDEPIDKLHVLINGTPIYGLSGQSIQDSSSNLVLIESTEKLLPGKNKIQVWCVNKKGIKSNRENIVVYSKVAAVKPTLYIAGIGASQFEDARWNLNYAAKDIRDFVSFYGVKNPNYDHIIIDTLVNERVTMTNITAMLTTLHKTEVGDHVIFYIAGHGVLNSNLDYYLATYNMNFSEPAKLGFSYSFFESQIEQIPARTKTIFIDACHSGELDKSSTALIAQNSTSTESGDITFRSVGSAVETKSGVGYANSFSLMKNIFTDLRESSGATIIASAGGAEFALEGSQWNNGVFTYSLLEGLKNKTADLNKDGKIYLSELQQYVQGNVSKLTGGRQRPISRQVNINNDYVFWTCN